MNGFQAPFDFLMQLLQTRQTPTLPPRRPGGPVNNGQIPYDYNNGQNPYQYDKQQNPYPYGMPMPPMPDQTGYQNQDATFQDRLRGQQRQRENTPLPFQPYTNNGFGGLLGLLPSNLNQQTNEIGMQSPRRPRPQNY